MRRKFCGLIKKTFSSWLLLRATRGACNPNRSFITRTSHVCNQHSFGLPLRMYGTMNAIWSRVFRPSTPRNRNMCVLTIYHVKLTQSTAMEQKRLDLWSLSPALPNLLVITSLVVDRTHVSVSRLNHWKNWTFYRDNKMSIICKFIHFL